MNGRNLRFKAESNLVHELQQGMKRREGQKKKHFCPQEPTLNSLFFYY